MADELGLHRLAVEDAAQGRQRPKLDRYEDTTSSPPTRCSSTWTVASWSLVRSHAFVTPAALVTVRRDEEFDIDALLTRWDD